MLPVRHPQLIIEDQTRDSRIWQQISSRETDIIISSAYKTGTTLTQQIVNLIVHGNDNFASIHLFSPWVETLIPAIQVTPDVIEALPDPRILKTHLPFEALSYYPEWKYIYLARDGRDVCVSLYNQRTSFLDSSKNTSKDFATFWDIWLKTGEPLYSLWEHIDSWWQARNLPNVLLLHYNVVTRDKVRAIEKIAHFLEVDLRNDLKELILEKSSFAYMKANSHKFEPPNLFKPKAFINKGVNGRWKELLTSKQLERYEQVLAEKLEPACAKWIKNGGFINSNMT